MGEGCELLDIASSILVAEAGPNFSRELQDTINRTLEEMAPAYVIELLALPLDKAKERKEGIRALRAVLWAEGEAALADRNLYAQEVNRHLTASEAVDLFIEAPDHVPADADEVYQSALVGRIGEGGREGLRGWGVGERRWAVFASSSATFLCSLPQSLPIPSGLPLQPSCDASVLL